MLLTQNLKGIKINLQYLWIFIIFLSITEKYTIATKHKKNYWCRNITLTIRKIYICTKYFWNLMHSIHFRSGRLRHWKQNYGKISCITDGCFIVLINSKLSKWRKRKLRHPHYKSGVISVAALCLLFFSGFW